MKYFDTAKFVSGETSFVNEFGVSNIDLLYSLNVKIAENHFESPIHLVM